jgi:TRAP-type C4-dicarboxylate transport system substrate-binding protein
MEETVQNRLLSLLTAATAFFLPLCAHAEDYPTLQVRMATIYGEANADTKALRRFKAAVEEKSGRRVTVRLTAGTALGGQNEINELLMTGGLDMIVHGKPPSARYLAFFLPYAIKSPEHLKHIMASDLAHTWNEELVNTSGLRMIGVWTRGTRHVIARKRYASMADLKNARIRVPNIPAVIAAVKSWQATPVVMSYAEVYTALATGAVDGLENTMGLMLGDRFYEVGKYVLLTGHATSPVFWLTNDVWWKKQPEKVRTLLSQEAASAMSWVIEENKRLEMQWAQDLKAKGIEIVTPTDPEAFRTAIASFLTAEATKAWGEDGWKKIQAMQ